jgi:hypothetical protein
MPRKAKRQQLNDATIADAMPRKAKRQQFTVK